MNSSTRPEVWLRGPIPGMSAYLQPVAHALLQAREEIFAALNDFPSPLLWKGPAGLASPGFHLQHITGVLQRLFTYAAGRQLSPADLAYLQAEGKPEPEITVKDLLKALHAEIDQAINTLQATDEKLLTEKRGVGRAQLPSTVLGLYVHAAEHTMRHTGQLLVTATILKAATQEPPR